MRNKEDTSIGKQIIIYFESDSASEMRAKRRPKKNGLLIKAVVVEASEGKRKRKIIATNSKRLFADKELYGGHGIRLNVTDKRIISQAEFDEIELFTPDNYETFCKERGYSVKKFVAAYKKFNKVPKKKSK